MFKIYTRFQAKASVIDLKYVSLLLMKLKILRNLN